MATTDLETRARSFEEEVAEAIREAQSSWRYEEFYGTEVPIRVEVPLDRRQEVFDYLRENQTIHGEFSPIEGKPLAETDKTPYIRLRPVREQAMNLARAVDLAYADKGPKPLRYVRKIYVSSCGVAHLD